MNAPVRFPAVDARGPTAKQAAIASDHTIEITSLDRQVTEARREMGEARWAELNAKWL